MSSVALSDFDDLYEHAPCGYLRIGPEGRIASANRTFAVWTEVARDDLIGRPFQETLHIAGRIYYETHLRPLLTMQGFVNEVALDFLIRSDTVLPTLVNLNERRDAAGSLLYIRMTVFKATDRRRYERDLLAARAEAQASAERVRELNEQLKAQITEIEAARKQSEELLRQSQKMEAIGQLTGGIAHDFNNLLAGITGSLEILERRLEQGRIDSLARYVSAARGAAKRAATLTHRLLAFSRRQQLEPQATDVNRVVGELEDMLRRSLGPTVRLQVIGAGGLWTTVIDRNQLENAVLNLCINGRDAMPEGGTVTIETSNKWLDHQVAVERDMSPGQYVALCVTDTGTGMTPEVLARAFDPFFTTKPSGVGTGLGLAMVHAFARQAGGQVRIYSELGKGTTICIYMPRHRGPAEESAAPAAITGSWQALHAETILIVDDEPTVRMMVSEALTEAGYHIVEAADGPTALKLLETSARFDLLITDLGLPGGLRGEQLANAAQKIRDDLKILFVTGYAENAVLENGLLAPDSRVLTKPFSIEALIHMVSGLLPE
jgi:signal transduction histidine kinase